MRVYELQKLLANLPEMAELNLVLLPSVGLASPDTPTSSTLNPLPFKVGRYTMIKDNNNFVTTLYCEE